MNATNTQDTALAQTVAQEWESIKTQDATRLWVPSEALTSQADHHLCPKVSRRIREYVGEGSERSAEIERHTLNMLFDEYLVVAEVSK